MRWLNVVLPAYILDPSLAELPSLVVNTDKGPVEGIRRFVFPEHAHVDKFLGIPYAAPPVGVNRFRAPQPVNESWGPSPRPTKVTPAPCPQLRIVGKVLLGKEDCLYMDIFTPSIRHANSKLPVLVWIYGGAFILGDSEEFSIYDGQHLALRHDIVVVTFNYRLSAMGFFALPELRAEDPDGSVGNQALQDQQAALRWVQRNIAQFGGDPGRITIAGESAGGFSVHWHLVSPRSNGLFHAAVSQSGTSRSDWFFQPLDEAMKFYGNFSAVAFGCHPGPNRLSCLRKVPFEDLTLSVPTMLEDAFAYIFHMKPPNSPASVPGAWPFMAFSPVIDGSEAGLLGPPLQLIQNGTFNKVPLVIGGNMNDGDIFLPAVPFWGGMKGLRFSLENFLGVVVENQTKRTEVLAAYSLEEFHTQTRRVSRFMRDIIFGCSSRNVARAFQDHAVPVWLYSFAFDFGKIGLLNVTATIGDCHAMELPFLFRNYIGIVGSMFGNHAGFVHASDVMTCAWASQVTCHNPRCAHSIKSCGGTEEAAPAWPHYNRANQTFYSIRANPSVEIIKEARFPEDEFAPDRRCDILETLQLSWRKLRPTFLKSTLRVFI